MSSIIFVCTGNTCRSPMAAAIAASIFKNEGLEISVLSAGVSAADGHPASENAALAMQEMGLELAAHKSQPALPEILEAAALVLTMTQGHLRYVKSAAPKANAFELGAYVGSPADVCDPFGGSLEVYRTCAAQIKELLHAGLEKFTHLANLPTSTGA